MIGFKGLTGGLVGVLLAGGVAMADTAAERGACLRGVAPTTSWMADGACGPALRNGHRRTTLRPVLGAVDGYPAVALPRGVPVRFTSLLILGVGY